MIRTVTSKVSHLLHWKMVDEGISGLCTLMNGQLASVYKLITANKYMCEVLCECT